MDLVTRRPTGLSAIAGVFQGDPKAWATSMLFGLGGAAILVGVYLSIISLAQGWAHAQGQLSEDRWFVGAVSVGFGTQVTLFAYLRSLHSRSSPGAMAASTGTSTAAMLACCAHHLADALPLIGLSGAAVFLNDFKEPILWAGLAMNGLGIAYLCRKIRQQRSLIPHIVRPLETPTPASSR